VAGSVSERPRNVTGERDLRPRRSAPLRSRGRGARDCPRSASSPGREAPAATRRSRSGRRGGTAKGGSGPRCRRPLASEASAPRGRHGRLSTSREQPSWSTRFQLSRTNLTQTASTSRARGVPGCPSPCEKPSTSVAPFRRTAEGSAAGTTLSVPSTARASSHDSRKCAPGSPKPQPPSRRCGRKAESLRPSYRRAKVEVGRGVVPGCHRGSRRRDWIPRRSRSTTLTSDAARGAPLRSRSRDRSPSSRRFPGPCSGPAPASCTVAGWPGPATIKP
jgi:hypothetical protein